MNNQDPSQKEPKDTVKDPNQNSNQNTIDQTSSETEYKILQEANNKKDIKEKKKMLIRMN